MSTLKWWQDNDRYIQEPFAEIVRYREEVEKMDSENAALKKRILDDNKAYGCELMDPSGTIWDHAKRLQQENAALRADKERLDWLLTDDGGFWVNWMYDKDEWMPELKASRDAIDACRNGRIGREKP